MNKIEIKLKTIQFSQANCPQYNNRLVTDLFRYYNRSSILIKRVLLADPADIIWQ